MESTVNRSASDPIDPGQPAAAQGGKALDVPGLLAGRIADVYASEERRQRHERTNRILREASDLSAPQ